MKRILFFVAVCLMSLTSCSKDDGVFLGSDDFSSSSSTSVQVATSSVPQSARNYIASNYAGYTIKEAQKELEHGATIYKVTIVKGNAKVRLLFDANWTFIGVKS
ncbi:MAG: hypothetical protein JNL70_03630 [Saprospiraceae bacterium]|nr:hypothetical protein [Saprospiraceae bacterium]